MRGGGSVAEDGDNEMGLRAGGYSAALRAVLEATPEIAVDARAWVREQTELARVTHG